VIASRHGAPADLVRDGETGFLFTPGDADALAPIVRDVFADRSRLARLRAAARREYEAKYTGAANHAMLMAAYRQAIETAGRARRRLNTVAAEQLVQLGRSSLPDASRA
jgi:glycosyltransferase involved in cell wall biosynthesis